MRTKPRMRIQTLCLLKVCFDSIAEIFPLKTVNLLAIKSGKRMDTSEGKNKCVTSPLVLTLWFIQSMVVVTSPIGDQAPPEFAAMIMNPAYHFLSSASETIFLKILIRTIVAVKLSISADSRKANAQMIQRSVVFRFVLIRDLKT